MPSSSWASPSSAWVSVPLLRNMAGVLDPLYHLTDGYFALLRAAAVPPLLRHAGGADLPSWVPSLPLLIVAVTEETAFRRSVALFYGINTLGAAAGHPRGGTRPDARSRDLRHGVGRRRRGRPSGCRGLPPRSPHRPPGRGRGASSTDQRCPNSQTAAGRGGHGRMLGALLPDRLDAPTHPGGGNPRSTPSLSSSRRSSSALASAPCSPPSPPSGRAPAGGRWPSPWGWARAQS